MLVIGGMCAEMNRTVAKEGRRKKVEQGLLQQNATNHEGACTQDAQLLAATLLKEVATNIMQLSHRTNRICFSVPTHDMVVLFLVTHGPYHSTHRD